MKSIELSKLDLAYITTLVGETGKVSAIDMCEKYKDEDNCDSDYQRYIADNAEDIGALLLFDKLRTLFDTKEGYEYKILLKEKKTGEFSISTYYYKSLSELIEDDFHIPVSIIQETKRLCESSIKFKLSVD